MRPSMPLSMQRVLASRSAALRICSRCLLNLKRSATPTSAVFAGQLHGLKHHRRWQHGSSNPPTTFSKDQSDEHFKQSWEDYKKYFHFPDHSSAQDFKVGNTVTVHGFISKRKEVSSKVAFANLLQDYAPKIELASAWQESGSQAHQLHQTFKSIPPFSPVSITGVVSQVSSQESRHSSPQKFPTGTDKIRVELQSIQALNEFPRNIIISDGVQFPPSMRHLQMRFSQTLRSRLDFRHSLQRVAERTLDDLFFRRIETPVLFKSTPEGAREFLVPTRRRGYAYALPQSPQQYKQILMASGFNGYYQFARCFRDEDLRADRQPEFTQLDLEMAFATGKDVMQLIETIVRDLFKEITGRFQILSTEGELVPVRKETYDATGRETLLDYSPLSDEPFPRLKYDDAMALYGSDKPDLRIPNKISRIDSILPRGFVSMISDLKNPAVDVCKFRPTGSIKENWAFIRELWDSLPIALAKNPDGAPAVMVFDSSKPMCGLSALGHEAFMELTGDGALAKDLGDFEDGDVLIVQAREDKPFEGGSTALGNVRLAFYQAAVEKGLLERDDSFKFLWVVGFPLFTPNNDVDPGQGGASGFSSTHHPFTAPLTSKDFELLATDPLRVKADHYDLVLNGVELGGGSRRIHVAEVQDYVLRDILKMSDEGISHFSHLLEALRAGCPPHAGFAFGWDRLVATLSFTKSVRDVIAFPKSMKGEDLMAKSPLRVTPEQLATYHLALKAK